MTDLEFTIRAICKRRGVTLSKIESVAMNFSIAWNLANDTYILPIVANTFYYVQELRWLVTGNVWVGIPRLAITPDSGQGGGAGSMSMRSINSSSDFIRSLECDSMRYQTGNATDGNSVIYGCVFKITYA